MLSPGLIAFAAGVAVSFLLTPPARRLAERCDVLDRPDRRRKLHRRLVPLWGGLAVGPALIAAAAAAWFRVPEGLGFRWPLLLAAGVLLAAAGLADDWVRLPPKVKLLGHVLAAGLAVAAGFRLETVTLPGSAGTWSIWPAAGLLFSLLWLTFMTNAYNFMDGIDGLASGYAVITGSGLAVVAGLWAARAADPIAAQQQTAAAVLAAAAAGAALGFWRYNRPPARIFLGDAGSTLLGFTLALAALGAAGRAATPWAPLVPVLLFGWPILDALLAVARRAARREPISKADHRHLHHVLQQHGFTPRAAAALILTLALALTALGVAAAWL